MKYYIVSDVHSYYSILRRTLDEGRILGSITNLSEKSHNKPLQLYEAVCKNYTKLKNL